MKYFAPENGLVAGPTIEGIQSGGDTSGFRQTIEDGDARTLFNYWLELVEKFGRLNKSDFDPIRVPRLLSRMYIEEWDTIRKQSRFRLMGEDLRLYFDKGAVGLCTDDHISGTVNELWGESDQLIYFEERPVLLAYDFAFDDRPHITVADLSLPFTRHETEKFAIGYIWELGA